MDGQFQDTKIVVSMSGDFLVNVYINKERVSSVTACNGFNADEIYEFEVFLKPQLHITCIRGYSYLQPFFPLVLFFRVW